ncbi:hypothetical protein ACFWF7_16280 [Nocardia sp. NPDC060256]|uniref:hypothetical protein n=1 Tax=unclassified Nocardia TaxID=2637762 RepID=UPI003654E543
MTQREISLKKDETLLVKWIAEPFRYARLVRVPGNSGPSAYLFDIHPINQVGSEQFSQVQARFYWPDCVVSYASGDDLRGSQVFYRNTWGQQTVKQLLVSMLAGYDQGYEIVDWGGFAVSDDRPATQVY